MSIDLHAKWMVLARRFENAERTRSRAIGVVTRKMSKVALGMAGAIPTVSELTTANEAEKRTLEIRKEMNAFIKRHKDLRQRS